jgi:formylglycine-generating enzyme required for sulfatase activity
VLHIVYSQLGGGNPMATPLDNLTLHRSKRTNKQYTEDLGNGVTLKLMLIPAGEFIMGAPKTEQDSDDRERPQHRVTLPTFLMGRYPVTQAQWRVVAGMPQIRRELNPTPSHFKGDNLPVEQVDWFAATEFCQRLSKQTGKNYHLPSEAQWEYACRAGTEMAYHFGPKLTEELANYGNPSGKTTPVGQYPANGWGLHDMHGNVYEWCQDHWHESYENAPTDGSAWLEGGNSSRRVSRGGSWIFDPWLCRSAFRGGGVPVSDDDFLGFRVCCAAPRTLVPPTG